MKNHLWVRLIIVLLLCAPPLLVRVGTPAPVRIMESLSFLSSQETWLRMHQGEPDAWKMPTWNGNPRVEKPPLLVWLNLAAWKGLDPSATVDDLVLRSRLVSAALALLAVASVFWIGAMLGGPRLATLAALATGSAWFFIRQARYASYDTHITGWATLAVAAGLWAIRAPTKRTGVVCLAWAAATLAITAANYTKGPIGLLLTIPPLAAAAAIFPERRRNVAGVIAAALASAGLLAPWFLLASARIPEAAERFQREYVYIFEMFKNPLAYTVLLGLVFPWTLWLGAGAVMPLINRERRREPGFLFSWGWLIILLLLFSLSPVKNKRYLVPLLPAAGLLVAHTWRLLQDKMAAARECRWARPLGRIHWGVLMLSSPLAGLFVVLQSRLVAAGVLSQVLVVGIPPLLAMIAAAALLGIAVAGWKMQNKARVHGAAILTALWMLIAATFGYCGYAAAPHEQWPFRNDAERAAVLAPPGRLFHISRFRYPDHEAMPSHEFLIYYRGVIPAITLDDIRARANGGDDILVMTRLAPEDEAVMEQAGFHHTTTIADGRKPDWKLWSRRKAD